MVMESFIKAFYVWNENCIEMVNNASRGELICGKMNDSCFADQNAACQILPVLINESKIKVNSTTK